MPSTRTVFCSKELREKVEARIGLFLGHTDRFSICGNVYDRLDYETHATDRLKLCVIYKYGNITYKAR